MAEKFKIVEKEYQYPNTGALGVVKDAFITDATYGLYTFLDSYGALPDGGIILLDDICNYGNGVILMGYYNSGYLFGILEVRIPSKSDLVSGGSVDIYSAKLELKWSGSRRFDKIPGSIVVGIVEIPDDFTEGTVYGRYPSGILPPAEAWCNWNKAKDGIPWQKGDNGKGAVVSRGELKTDDGTPSDSARISISSEGSPPSITQSITLDITEYAELGELKRFAIFVLDKDADDFGVWGAYSNEAITPANRPKLIVKYRDYPPEAFTDGLTIEPNPDNPEQPLLKWKGVKDADFVDFKVYRSTSPITSVASLTPIATITNPTDQEYVDTATLTDGQVYYYLVIAEDQNNTGNDSTFSTNVSFTKPDITSLSISPAGPYTVGQMLSITVSSPQAIKRVWVDWKDGSQSWYDFESTGTSKTVSHYYSAVLTSQTPQVRIEDDKGFWSGLDSATAITTGDINPVAKLVVNEKSVIEGEIVALSGVFSQPMGSNATITKYEFTLNNGVSWNDNFSNPIYLLDTTGWVGTHTLGIRITTSSGKIATSIGTVLQVVSGTPEELKFSQDTTVEEISHSLSQLRTEKTPIGSDGVEYDFLMARRPDIITLSMSTATPHLEEDINIVREAWLNDKFVRIRTRAEFETKEIIYDGTINGDIEIVQQFHGVVVWNLRLKVINRIESFIPGLSGAITGVATAGAGLLQITSTNHGLKVGDEIFISGTTDYNGGTIVVSTPLSNVFIVRGTFVSTQTGTWIKKTYANQN
jgi:hypothetical protein